MKCSLPPLVLLLIFSLSNFICYFDRGILGGSLKILKNEPGYGLENDETRQGMLQSAFVIGFTVAAPIFGHLSHRVRSTYLMSLGLAIWVGSSALAGFSWNYYSLLLGRVLIGIGEASFAGLAPTFIDDTAAPEKRATYLAVFFSTIAIGQACGYVGSAAIATHWGWRATFLVQAAVMIPFVLILLVVQAPSHGASVQSGSLLDDADDDDDDMLLLSSGELGVESSAPVHPPSLKDTLLALLGNPVYVQIVIGYAIFTAVVGVLGLFVPAWSADRLGISTVAASTAFGVCTAMAGLIGTAVGGLIADRKKHSTVQERNLHTIMLTVIFIAAGTPFAVFGFLFGTRWYLLFPPLFVGEVIIFMSVAPLNSVTLGIVGRQFRSPAMTMQIFFIHLLGDLPAPVLVGAVLKSTKQLYGDEAEAYVMAALMSLCFFSAVVWFLARRTYQKSLRTNYAALLLNSDDNYFD